MALTETQIKRAKPRQKPYKLTDEDGLTLLVTPAGRLLWRLRYRQPGMPRGGDRSGQRESMVSLGRYPEVSLKKARERAAAERLLLADKINPAHKRVAEKHAAADTFEAVGREYLLRRLKPKLAPVTYQRAVWTLETLAFPFIGSRPIRSIQPTDVLLSVLRRIEAKGNHVTARRACQRISQVFRYAVATSRADSDVTRDLRGALAPAVVEHHAAITEPARIGELLRAIDGYSGHGVTLYALKLAPYLFVRPGELRHAEWTEFDLVGAHPQWLIPAQKMKMRAPHLVPLATQAVALLRDLQRLTGPTRGRIGRYVFPALTTPKRPMSENTENTALRRLGYSKDEMTAHGFRSLATTRLYEGFGGHRFAREWIERQLAHAEGNAVTRAYNYAEHLPERRKMMQAWADYLDELRAAAPP